MVERAHPEDSGFRHRFFGLKRSPYRDNLFRRYKFCNNYIKGKVVLDIPCGVGWGTSLLKGAKKICGVDISPEAIEYAVKHYQNTEFKVGNMNNIPYSPNTFDVIICLEGFEHVDPKTGLAFLSEVTRCCRFGGILILTCPTLNDEGKSTGNPYHLKEYDHQELVRIMNDCFQIIYLEKFQGPDGPEIKFVCKIVK